MSTYAWSFDGEDFSNGTFDSVAEAVAAAFAGGESRTLCYVGECEHPDASSFVSADSVIDSARDRARDECGEWAEDWLSNVSEEKIAELDRLLSEWIESVESPTFYRVVNIVEVQRPAP